MTINEPVTTIIEPEDSILTPRLTQLCQDLDRACQSQEITHGELAAFCTIVLTTALSAINDPLLQQLVVKFLIDAPSFENEALSEANTFLLDLMLLRCGVVEELPTLIMTLSQSTH